MRNVLPILILILLGTAVGAQQASAPTPTRPPRPARPGRVHFALRDGASDEDRRAVERLAGSVPPGQEHRIAEELRATGAVRYAEPDYRVRLAVSPNDPYLPYQWHHSMLGSCSAWDRTTGRASLVVAVCDTGVESTHPDLAPHLIHPGFNSANGSTWTEPVYGPSGWHGTAVAGCIAATGDNAEGVAGMAWNVRLLPVRVTDDPDGSAWIGDIAAGVRWAADRGARIINISFGVGDSFAFDDAARYARAKGALVFVAAGNDGQDISSWPNFNSFLLVAGRDWNDAWDGFSNYGTAVDLAAPSVGIWTTSLYGGYGSASGTSFAAPLAAGVAALVWSENPSLSAGQVEAILISTARGPGSAGTDYFVGHGRVDAAKAVESAVPPPRVNSRSSSGGHGDGGHRCGATIGLAGNGGIPFALWAALACLAWIVRRQPWLEDSGRGILIMISKSSAFAPKAAVVRVLEEAQS